MSIPRFDGSNPIIGASWKAWGGWAWWVWEFANGWHEWIPCYMALCSLIDGQRNPPEPTVVANLKVTLLKEIHSWLVGEYEGPLVNLVVEQLAYRCLEKSDWYYNSLPTYVRSGTSAAGGRSWWVMR